MSKRCFRTLTEDDEEEEEQEQAENAIEEEQCHSADDLLDGGSQRQQSNAALAPANGGGGGVSSAWTTKKAAPAHVSISEDDEVDEDDVHIDCKFRLTTTTSTPNLVRTWTCFECALRNEASVTWHCVNCETVSYLAPVYKETLLLKRRPKQRGQRVGQLKAPFRRRRAKSMEMGLEPRRARRLRLTSNSSVGGVSGSGLGGFVLDRRMSSSKVYCVHRNATKWDYGDDDSSELFGSPIKGIVENEEDVKRLAAANDGSIKCVVCGVCEKGPAVEEEVKRDKEEQSRLDEGQSRFTITTLAKRRSDKTKLNVTKNSFGTSNNHNNQGKYKTLGIERW